MNYYNNSQLKYITNDKKNYCRIEISNVLTQNAFTITKK